MNLKRVFCVLFFTAVLSLVLSSGIVSATDLTPEEMLGKNLFFDKISVPDWMSCATCHDPKAGWTGPVGGINKHGAVYRGAVPQRFGNRKPPSSAYATFSPIFSLDSSSGEFVGGNFWDGRATGEKLGNPAADQALGPFLNPVEQNNPSKKAVLEQIARSKYAGLWEIVYGEPISYETDQEVDENYDRVGLAIAAYEDSSEVNQFSSKYDAYLQGLLELTEQELWGWELFHLPNDNDGVLEDGEGGNCAACHPTIAPSALTDFTYDNLGVPRNPENPFYDMDRVLLDDGTAINPDGRDWIDPGLGGFLEKRPEWSAMAPENMGKHKVPTLRNVDKREDYDFPKAYAHNGYFKSLKSIVHFYNTRDAKDTCPNDPSTDINESLFTTEKDALKMNCWPAPEVPENVNTDELGDLGLSPEEEDAIVAFMKTLSDSIEVGKQAK